jgi:hypothetical protein
MLLMGLVCFSMAATVCHLPVPMFKKNVLIALLLAIAVSVGVHFYSREKAAAVDVVAEPAKTVIEKPFIGPRTKGEAMAELMALPELKAWSQHIEKSSGGVSKGALIEYGPTPKTIGDKRFWQLSYVESTPDAAHRWESFLVGENTPEILVEDDETDQPLTLEQWRKDKQPLARTSAK